MEFTTRQLACVLAALRTCQTMDLSGMPHFDEAPPLSPEEINDLCEALNANPRGAFTVVGLLPDSDWDGSMRNATYVEHAEAETPSEAARAAQLSAARSRNPASDTAESSEEEIEEYASNIEIIAVFPGFLQDLYDPREDPRNSEDEGGV